VFKLGIAIIKMVLSIAPNLTTSMAIFLARSQGLHQTCPAVFDAIRCLLTTGSDVRAINTAESMCSSLAKSKGVAPCVQQPTATSICSMMHAALHGIDHDHQRVYVLFFDALKICYKVFPPITKVNEGESNTPCSSTLEVTYSSG
jgi:hypothetical protein